MLATKVIPWNSNVSVNTHSDLSPFADFEGIMNRFFGRSGAMAWPAVEISSDENTYTVFAEVPGLEKDDIRIELKDNVLSLRGERERKGSNYSERYYGRFERELPIPKTVNPDTASATFKNGVLEIVFQKREEATPRQIEIA